MYLVHNKQVGGKELVIPLSHYGQPDDSISFPKRDAQLPVTRQDGIAMGRPSRYKGLQKV